MIGMFGEHAATFLRVLAVLTLLAFAIPISLAPMRWATTLRWEAAGRNDLALYFGRCLGVVALVLVGAAWHAAGNPAVQPFYFQIQIGASTLLMIVHVVGALQKVQPWTETAEIPFWGGIALLSVLFYPTH